MLNWMYWSVQSVIGVLILVGILVVLNIINIKYPAYSRKGFLPISTTRGDRFFIILLFTIICWFLWLKFTDIPIFISYAVVIPIDFIIMKWA